MKKKFLLFLMSCLLCGTPLRAEFLITTIDAQENVVQIASIDSITFTLGNMLLHFSEQNPVSLPLTDIQKIILKEDFPSAITTPSTESYEMSVYDLSGKCVREDVFEGNLNASVLKGLPAATYIIKTKKSSLKIII